MPASSWTLWNRLFMIGRPCKEAGSSTTSIEAAQCVSIRYTARLAEAGVEPSVGSVGDSYDALAETINGLYTAEVTHRCGPWRSCEAVEFATLELVDRFNNRWLLEPIGNIPPAEAEERYYAMLNEPAMAACLKRNSLRSTRSGSNATEAARRSATTTPICLVRSAQRGASERPWRFPMPTPT